MLLLHKLRIQIGLVLSLRQDMDGYTADLIPLRFIAGDKEIDRHSFLHLLRQDRTAVRIGRIASRILLLHDIL